MAKIFQKMNLFKQKQGIRGGEEVGGRCPPIVNEIFHFSEKLYNFNQNFAKLEGGDFYWSWLGVGRGWVGG